MTSDNREDSPWPRTSAQHGQREIIAREDREQVLRDVQAAGKAASGSEGAALASLLGIGHNRHMGNDELTASATETADLSGNVAKRLLRYFRAQVEDWHDVCRHLSDWEDRYLVDAPTPEHLAEHGRLLVERTSG